MGEVLLANYVKSGSFRWEMVMGGWSDTRVSIGRQVMRVKVVLHQMVLIIKQRT